MTRVRRLLPILVLASVLTACGGSKHAADAGLTGAAGRTVAQGTASFTILISGTVAGTQVRTSETGTVSFTDTRAHFYKLAPGGGLPQEIVLDGPYTFTNANVQAAMNDPSVRPWTKLDTRKLPASDAKTHPSELEHVRAVAYLADGVGNSTRVGSSTVDGETLTHYRGLVDPARVAASAPPGERKALRDAVHNDYLAKPFAADFWLDGSGRVRRVRVDYRTAGGSRIVVNAALSGFGTKIDVTVPPPGDVQDITP
jgi:hypothetical protein